MKSIKESIIGKRGGPGPFQSIIVIPMDSDYITYSHDLSYVVPFEFGRTVGFTTIWDNAEDIYKNTISPNTLIFISEMPIDKFIKEFLKINKDANYGTPKSPIEAPDGSKRISPDELGKIVKKK